MAALTWRNVDLPNFDLRGLAVAGNGISDAFSRMGEMLIQRENSLRQQATDAALAKVFMAGNQGELDTLRQGGLGGLGNRVNQRDFAEAIANRRGALQQEALTQEDLLNKQAMATLGDEGAALVSAASRGDKAAMDTLMAKASEDPLWGRVAYGFMQDAATQYGNAETRGETRRHNFASEATDNMRVRNDSRRVAIAEEQQAWARQDHVRGEQVRRDQERYGQTGRRFVDELLKRNVLPSEAESLLVNTPVYKAASPAGKEALRAQAKARVDEMLLDSTLKQTRAGVGEAANLGTQIDSGVKVFNSVVDNNLVRNNPALAIYQRAQDPAYQNATIDQVKEKWAKSSDIYNSPEYIERLRAGGMSLAELMAMPDIIDMKDRVWDPEMAGKTALLAGAGGAAGGGIPGAIFGVLGGGAAGGFDFTSGTQRTDAVVQQILEMRKPGNLPAAMQEDMEARKEGMMIQTQLDNLRARIEIERKTVGVRPESLIQMRALQARLQELTAAARGETLPKK